MHEKSCKVCQTMWNNIVDLISMYSQFVLFFLFLLLHLVRCSAFRSRFCHDSSADTPTQCGAEVCFARRVLSAMSSWHVFFSLFSSIFIKRFVFNFLILITFASYYLWMPTSMLVSLVADCLIRPAAIWYSIRTTCEQHITANSRIVCVVAFLWQNMLQHFLLNKSGMWCALKMMLAAMLRFMVIRNWILLWQRMLKRLTYVT